MKYRIKGPGTADPRDGAHLPLVRPQSGTLLAPESPGGMGLFLSYSYFAYPPSARDAHWSRISSLGRVDKRIR